MSNPRLISTREVADRLGISPRQVARLVPDSLSPAVRVAGLRGAMFFDECDVQALAASRGVGIEALVERREHTAKEGTP